LRNGFGTILYKDITNSSRNSYFGNYIDFDKLELLFDEFNTKDIFYFNYKNYLNCIIKKYEGNFENNEMNGIGKFFYINGDEFHGKFLNNKKIDGKYISSDKQ
jgi:hypothetical protein